MSSEVEETLKRIQSHRGVKGVLIINQEGIPIRSNMNQEDTDTYAALISQLNFKANGIIRTLDETDSLTFLRLRSQKHEIMVAPDKDFTLIVVQNPNAD
ncbi:putative flagellar outer dynein arm light chain LC7 [Tribonema minus]|uniref:Dynein light chain roadblock n=1 Tax=Tribonema minus TaxID=303371 RepID=A0A836CL08_9STRA|nr:putative flagellar outer dynein arm light chain LC7 [Tribonema minus]